ncbi:MAG: glycosyltransferase [Verrucomicrobiota bacterium]
MRTEFTLSYVLTTRNKLPLLKELVKRLVANAQPDEEIIIIDAASTDGTTEFLRELHREGHIHQFISERDRGEAHGLNKGILRARGQLIKVLSDDDAFYWPGIQACKQFLLEHPECHLMGAQSANTLFERPEAVYICREFDRDFEEWRRTGRRFFFNGLPLMLRRSALPLVGLFNADCIAVDFEFTLRVTGSANLAWYDSVLALRIDNSASNYRTQSARILAEVKRYAQMYDRMDYVTGNQPPPPTALQRLRRVAGATKRRILGRIFTPPPPPASPPSVQRTPAKVMELCDAWLVEHHRKHPGRVLVREEPRAVPAATPPAPVRS